MRLSETQPHVDLSSSKPLSEVIMGVDTHVGVGGGGGVNDGEACRRLLWSRLEMAQNSGIWQLGSWQMRSSHVPMKKGNRSLKQVAGRSQMSDKALSGS